MVPQSRLSVMNSPDASKVLPELVPESGKMAQVYLVYPKTVLVSTSPQGKRQIPQALEWPCFILWGFIGGPDEGE